MRILSKYSFIGLSLLFLSLVSCETLEKADQEVSPVVSPDGYPVATFTASDNDNTITEGDTLFYTISMNKMLDRAVTFSARLTEGTLEESDYVVVPAVMSPYTNAATLMIIFNDDGVPRSESKTGKFEVGVFGIADHYLMNPSQEYPVADMTVNNYNDPTLLTIYMAWEGDTDFDIVIWSDTEDYPMTAWSDQGATGANPEVDKAIWLSDPVGTYYVSIMDWDSGPFDYNFTIGHPDGSVQTITGTFDKAAKTYINDPWTAWGDAIPSTPELDGYDSYRVLQVTNDGSTFTVTELVD